LATYLFNMAKSRTISKVLPQISVSAPARTPTRPPPLRKPMGWPEGAAGRCRLRNESTSQCRF